MAHLETLITHLRSFLISNITLYCILLSQFTLHCLLVLICFIRCFLVKFDTFVVIQTSKTKVVDYTNFVYFTCFLCLVYNTCVPLMTGFCGVEFIFPHKPHFLKISTVLNWRWYQGDQLLCDECYQVAFTPICSCLWPLCFYFYVCSCLCFFCFRTCLGFQK